jgi:hypothetical protein
MGVDGLVYRDHLVLRQVDEIVAPKEPTVNEATEERQPGCPGSKEAAGKALFNELHKPERPAQSAYPMILLRTKVPFPRPISRSWLS